MAQHAGVRRPNGKGKTPSRSVRVSDDIWDGAARRAAYEGHSLSFVIQSFLEAYGDGKVNVPQRVIIPAVKP